MALLGLVSAECIEGEVVCQQAYQLHHESRYKITRDEVCKRDYTWGGFVYPAVCGSGHGKYYCCTCKTDNTEVPFVGTCTYAPSTSVLSPTFLSVSPILGSSLFLIFYSFVFQKNKETWESERYLDRAYRLICTIVAIISKY